MWVRRTAPAMRLQTAQTPAARPLPITLHHFYLSAPARGGREGKQRNHQRGTALLAAMLTVALVATLAAAALWQQWRDVEVEAAERARAQSAWLLTSALDWGRLVLAGDLAEDERASRMGQPAADHLGEPWAVPLAESRLASFLGAEGEGSLAHQAFLSGEVLDLQARMNVMNLLAASADARAAARLRFARLFELLRLPAAELEHLARQLERADAALAAGMAGEASILPTRIGQLTWLGLSEHTVSALQPYTTLLPLASGAITKINLNTASAQVLYAALPGLDAAGAQRLASRRAVAPFRSVDDATATMQASSGVDTSWAAVTTEFFEIRGQLRLGSAALQEAAAVQRSRSPRRVTTLWRQREALVLEDEEESKL